jgi:hypothetical protein
VAWSDWAENPTVSEQPTVRHDERRQLEQRRALAAADLRAADAAVSAVQVRIGQLSAEMRALAPQIYACRLESVMTEVPEIERQILDAHRQMHEELARLRGLNVALAEEKAAAFNRGDEASAIRIQEALSFVESLQQPAPGASSWGMVLAQAETWRAALR